MKGRFPYRVGLFAGSTLGHCCAKDTDDRAERHYTEECQQA
jgi:hypothetical protein